MKPGPLLSVSSVPRTGTFPRGEGAPGSQGWRFQDGCVWDLTPGADLRLKPA